jgi:hypothetical protein
VLLTLFAGGSLVILLVLWMRRAAPRVHPVHAETGALHSVMLLPSDSAGQSRGPRLWGMQGKTAPMPDSGPPQRPQSSGKLKIYVQDALGRAVPRCTCEAWIFHGDALAWSYPAGELPEGGRVRCPEGLSGAATIHVWDPRDAEGNPLPLLPRMVAWPDVSRQPIEVRLELTRDLRGVVRTADGEPYTPVGITARYVIGTSAEGRTRCEEAHARLGPKGEYAFERLPRAPLQLFIRGLPPESYLAVDQVPGSVRCHDVVVGRGGRWTARLLGPDGRPVSAGYAGVRGFLSGVSWNAMEPSAPDGTVSVGGIPQGASFCVELGAAGDDPPLAPILLHGQTAGTLSEPIRLERGVYVRGRLVDEGGKGVPSQGVYLTPDPRLPDPLWAYRERATYTDAEGRFEFGPLPDTEYWIAPRRSKPHAYFEPRRVRGGDGELVIRAPHFATAFIRVVGTDPARVIAQWYGRRFTTTGIPRDSGLFEFWIPDGEFGAVLLLDRQAGLYAYQPLDGDSDRIEAASLVPGQRISGTVRGLPTFEGADPIVEAVGAGVWISTAIDASGGFELRALPPGRYDLTVLVQQEYLGDLYEPFAFVADVVAGTIDLDIRAPNPP